MLHLDEDKKYFIYKDNDENIKLGFLPGVKNSYEDVHFDKVEMLDINRGILIDDSGIHHELYIAQDYEKEIIEHNLQLKDGFCLNIQPNNGEKAFDVIKENSVPYTPSGISDVNIFKENNTYFYTCAEKQEKTMIDKIQLTPLMADNIIQITDKDTEINHSITSFSDNFNSKNISKTIQNINDDMQRFNKNYHNIYVLKDSNELYTTNVTNSGQEFVCITNPQINARLFNPADIKYAGDISNDMYQKIVRESVKNDGLNVVVKDNESAASITLYRTNENSCYNNQYLTTLRLENSMNIEELQEKHEEKMNLINHSETVIENDLLDAKDLESKDNKLEIESNKELSAQEIFEQEQSIEKAETNEHIISEDEVHYDTQGANVEDADLSEFM